MRTIIKNIKYCIYALLLLGLPACKHQDLDVYTESENYRNASDFLANNYDLSLFYAALKQAGMLETLKGEGPYTLFAPNDKAFNDIGIVRPSDFAKMNADSLRFMLNYHILPRRLYREDIPRNTIDNRYQNLAGKELYLAYRYSKGCSDCPIISEIYVNGSFAPRATQNAILANGILHLVDKVLKYKPTVQQILEGKPEYSMFVAALKHFGQWDALAGAGPFTIFAPDNTSFISAGITAEQIRALNPADYAKRLWGIYIQHNHFFVSDMLIYGRMPGSGYFGGPFYKAPIVGDEDYSFGISGSLTGESPYGGVPFIIRTNASNPDNPLKRGLQRAYIEMDQKADNGIVHGISGLLVLPAEARIK